MVFGFYNVKVLCLAEQQSISFLRIKVSGIYKICTHSKVTIPNYKLLFEKNISYKCFLHSLINLSSEF